MSDALRVRPATLDDIPRLAAIEDLSNGRDAAADILASELTRSWARLFAGEMDREVVAFLDGWLVADEFEVHFVASHPSLRRQGSGAAVLDASLTAAAAEGARTSVLEVRRGNVAAQGLYRSRGFEVVAERVAYYRDGEDALVLRCDLARYLGGPRTAV